MRVLTVLCWSLRGKNKDTDKAQIDLQNMNFMHTLHLKQRPDGSYDKSRAFFSLSPNENMIIIMSIEVSFNLALPELKSWLCHRVGVPSLCTNLSQLTHG